MAITAGDLGTVVWRRSSYSNGSGGDCVEVADGQPGVLPVRDSKASETGPVLLFRTPAWTAFLTSLKG
ncbi:DUF397 domain-containing protein [Streptomyces sp. NPDC050546]|uniref:DUF397 domain-containing protein n=1 Tax=Streptomyces sp. NPDC050546 TaxID=3365628 RepID=UPI0037ADD3C0